MISIYRVIWSLIQILYSIVLFIKSIWVRLRKKCMELLSRESLKDDLEFISKHVKLVDKTPSHLVVIIGNESVSYNDLANITIWCIAAGISFISFYDHNGILKKNEAKLYKVIAEKNICHNENINWGKINSTNGLINKNGRKNGKSSKKITVNMFSLTDGKGSIAEVASRLSQSVVEGKLKSSDINQEMLNKMFQAECGLPDPELALCCGTTLCTYGFLPWQISTTEFLQMHTHHNIKVTEFMSLLKSYGKCEQRFGK